MKKIKEAALQGRQLVGAAIVQRKTSLSRTTIWRLIRAGDFPCAVRLSSNRVAWDAAAVDAWIATRSAQSEAA